MGLFGKGKDTKKDSPEALWEQYYNASQEQKWEEAVQALETLLKKDRQSSKIQMKLGDALQRKGDTKKAIAAYHKAAGITISNGFGQKALAIYKIILRLDPKDQEARQKSGEIVNGISSPTPAAKGAPAPPPPPSDTPFGEFEGYGSLDMPSVSIPAPGPEPEPEPAGLPPMEELVESQHEKEPTPSGLPPLDEPEASPSVEEELPTGLPSLEELSTPEPEEVSPAMEAPPEPEPVAVPESEPVAGQSEGPEEFQLPSVFSFLMPDEQEEFISKANPASYDNGETIIREGESGDTMYIIKSGYARVVSEIMGKTIQLAVLGPGDFFGEVAFLTGRPRTASVVASGEILVLEVEKPLLQETIDKNPLILDSLVELYHSRAQDTVEKIKGSR